MLMQYRGVCKRACSASFLEEFFSETRLPSCESRELLLGKGRGLPSSTLPTPVRDPPTDTPPLMPYRRFANASPCPAELATPSPRTSRNMEARSLSSTGYHVSP